MSTQTKKPTSTCPGCSGKLEIDTSKEVATCSYCGLNHSVSALLGQSDTVQVEKIKSQTQKDMQAQQIEHATNMQTQQINHATQTQAQQSAQVSLQKFKKGAFGKILIIFAVISLLCCIMAFKGGNVLSGIATLIMTVLFIARYLVGMQVIKLPNDALKTVITLAAFLMIIPSIMLGNSGGGGLGVLDKSEPFVWSELELGSILPEPESKKGRVVIDAEDKLMIDVHEIDTKQYKAYIEACKEKGFTIDADKNSVSYSAYNEEGYKLRLMHMESRNEMDIHLDAPEEMNQITWPTSEMVKTLPVPKSTVGKIMTESSDGFIVSIGETTKEAYNAYVAECSEKGYNVDYSKDDNYYRAKNEKGYSLSLSYEGNNTMEISVANVKEETGDEPVVTDTPAPVVTETPKPVVTETPPPATQAPTPDTGAVRPEIKTALDSYEEFFNNYVSFMKRYKESPDDLGVITEYATYMASYTDMMSKLSQLENDNLNSAELAYYLEVHTRINNKLLEVAQ